MATEAISTAEVVSTPAKPKPAEPPLSLTANQIAIGALAAEGVSGNAIAKMLGITPAYANRIKGRIAGKYDLTSNKMVKSAHRAIKSLVAGEAFGDIEKVKDSTALAAAQMIYDRAQPVVKQTPDGPASVTYIDLSGITINQRGGASHNNKDTMQDLVDITPADTPPTA